MRAKVGIGAAYRDFPWTPMPERCGSVEALQAQLIAMALLAVILGLGVYFFNTRVGCVSRVGVGISTTDGPAGEGFTSELGAKVYFERTIKHQFAYDKPEISESEGRYSITAAHSENSCGGWFD